MSGNPTADPCHPQLDQESAGALWSIREDFVAVVVTQAPMVYPLFGRQFWQAAYGTGDGSRDESAARRRHAKAGSNRTGESHELTFGSATMNRVKRPKDPYSLTQLGLTQMGGSESQEEMINSPTNQTATTVGTAILMATTTTTTGVLGNGGLMAGQGEAVVVIDGGNKNSTDQTRSFSQRSRCPTEKSPGNAVVIEKTVSTTVAVCPEEQKRRDLEAWRRQPWEA